VSDLIAVEYPDKKTAEEVRIRLLQLMAEHVIELEDAVIVDRDESGKVKLHQVHNPAAQGAAGGASGAMVDLGVNDDFVRTLGQKLPNGGAALILLVRKITPDKVLPQISQFGGEVIQTSLDDESEARLREVLELRERVAQPVVYPKRRACAARGQ
jgi:uncharacterized membrane protein